MGSTNCFELSEKLDLLTDFFAFASSEYSSSSFFVVRTFIGANNHALGENEVIRDHNCPSRNWNVERHDKKYPIKDHIKNSSTFMGTIVHLDILDLQGDWMVGGQMNG